MVSKTGVFQGEWSSMESFGGSNRLEQLVQRNLGPVYRPEHQVGRSIPLG
jgi:hypothetical protein